MQMLVVIETKCGPTNISTTLNEWRKIPCNKDTYVYLKENNIPPCIGNTLPKYERCLIVGYNGTAQFKTSCTPFS